MDSGKKEVIGCLDASGNHAVTAFGDDGHIEGEKVPGTNKSAAPRRQARPEGGGPPVEPGQLNSVERCSSSRRGKADEGRDASGAESSESVDDVC